MAYGYTLDDLMRAFGAVESSQDYGEIGPLTRDGDRAYGRYQVMDFNVPNWTQRYTGTRMTPEQFLQDPAAQDAVFRGELGSYYNSGQGDPRTRALNAASMWFTGHPYSAATANWNDTYITNDEYLRRIGEQLDLIAGNSAVANAMNQPVASRSAAPSPATAPMSPELTALSMGQTNIAPTTGIFGSQQGGRNMVDQTQPQGGFLSGLLSRIGMQRQDPMAGGEAAMPFYQRPQFRDFATNLGLAMGGLATRPNEAAARALEARQVASAEERRASRTVEWLAQQPGGAVFVRMIEAGASPAQAIAAWQQEQQRIAASQQPRYEQVGDRLVQIGPDGVSEVFSAADQFRPLTAEESAQLGVRGQINTATGEVRPYGGGQGFVVEQTPDGMRILSGDVRTMLEQEQRDQAAEARAEQQARSAGIVTREVDNVLAIMDQPGVPVTGSGSFLRFLPGTRALAVQESIKTILSNAGFDRLQQLRDASPTGGALGQVSNTELQFLQAAFGSLNQELDAQTLRRNLINIRNVYSALVDGQAPAGFTNEQWAEMSGVERVDVLNGEQLSPQRMIELSTIGSGPQAPQEAIDMLLSDPSEQAQRNFDAIFGSGAAARILGGR